MLFKLGVKFSYMDNRQVNLIPFETLASKDTGVAEIILNVLIFIPVGIYAGIIMESGVRKMFLLFFMISLVVEALQYTFRIGAFDVTDLITNTSGGMIGFFLFYGSTKLFGGARQARKYLTALGAIGTILMILFLVLLKTGNLGIRYQ